MERHEVALIGGGGGLRLEALRGNGMDIARRDRNTRKQRLARHAKIAFGMIVRDEPFIAPKEMGARPGKSVAIRRSRASFS